MNWLWFIRGVVTIVYMVNGSRSVQGKKIHLEPLLSVAVQQFEGCRFKGFKVKLNFYINTKNNHLYII